MAVKTGVILSKALSWTPAEVEEIARHPTSSSGKFDVLGAGIPAARGRNL